MKLRNLVLVLVLNFTPILLAQQIIVDTSLSPQQLIEESLIDGCISISDVVSSHNGSAYGTNSYGYFERGTSNFPFSNGIVLTTGDAYSAGNELVTDILNDGDNEWGADPYLENSLGVSHTLNATSIEFNFISATNFIQFNYLLASEEYYGNYPCFYSDTFVFLIRKSGTNNPFINIALIPNTDVPVSVSTVHDEIIGFCDAENSEYFEGYNLGATNYNGRSKVLTASAMIEENTEYEIKLIIADNGDKNFDSAVFIEANSFTTQLELGDNIETCATSLNLNTEITNNDAIIKWYRDNVLIEGETNPNLLVFESATYSVEVELPIGNDACSISDSVQVILDIDQNLETFDDILVCDETTSVDLEAYKEGFIELLPHEQFELTFFASNQSAETNTNAIVSPFNITQNTHTVYIRIEDEINNCLSYSEFSIIQTSVSEIGNPTPISLCVNANETGMYPIDLSIKNNEVANGAVGVIITYHYTLEQAESSANPIQMPYYNESPYEIVYVRMEDSETGCYDTTSLEVFINLNPVLNDITDFTICSEGDDGYSTFDLSDFIVNALNQFNDNIQIIFYNSITDLNNNANEITNTSSFINTEAYSQTIYFSIYNVDTGCSSTYSINLISTSSNFAIEFEDFNVCDFDADGIEEISLSEVGQSIAVQLEIDTGLASLIKFYENETDRDNQINELDYFSTYTWSNFPKTLYLDISQLSCHKDGLIELVLNETPNFPTLPKQYVCDRDLDGITIIRLRNFTNLLINGDQSNFSVTYHNTQEAAENYTGFLPSYYQNSNRVFTVYARIQSRETGCFIVNSFDIEVLDGTTAITNYPIEICKNESENTYLNLNEATSNIIGDLPNRIISFHSNIDFAEQNEDSISDIDNYLVQESETVVMRIENSISGCINYVNINIDVNLKLDIQDINPYILCENDNANTGEFILNIRDNEILQNMEDLDVLYFTSVEDAINRENRINKNIPYHNTSNPQTIYVRVENIGDQDCFVTSSLELQVLDRTLYNKPTDIFVCDDEANDGITTVDLNDKIAEITEGINDDLIVKFFLSETDAMNNSEGLPLNFTNTLNPQEIYVNITNGNGCNIIEVFEVNVIQIPIINETQTLSKCDDNNDGMMIFDLTEVTPDVLGVRQDNIETSYFETIDDLHSDTNPISDPVNYQNNSNPQTVYLKAYNTISSCYAYVPIILSVNLLPIVNQVEQYDVCETEIEFFSLDDITPALIDNVNGLQVDYYTSIDNLYSDNELEVLTAEDFNTLNNTEIFVKVTDIFTRCYSIGSFYFSITDTPVAPELFDVYRCDDDGDGYIIFDFYEYDNPFGSDSDVLENLITYHNSEINAIMGENPLSNAYEVYNEATIYVRVENIKTGCYIITSFKTIVSIPPIINIPDQVVCLNNLPLVVSAYTGNDNDNYLWSTGEITAEIAIETMGEFTIQITNINGCTSTQTFRVTESETATITSIDVLALHTPAEITINYEGSGTYVFILNNGEQQYSNIFSNVPIGYHTVTIMDEGGCAETTQEIVAVGMPKFFTPNNDSNNDYWHMKGVETLPGTEITIFDRYGKVLDRLTSTDIGWDGKYNGNLMPTSDYWYVAEVIYKGEKRQLKGHFTLKR